MKKKLKYSNNVIGCSILTRPKSIDLREERGHWELDLIVGHKGYLLVIQELGKEHFKTITTDNGIEFYHLYKVERPLDF